MEWSVRKAVPGEEAAVSHILAATWQTAYKGIIDQAYLDRIDESSPLRLSRFAQDIARGNILVAQRGGEIPGAAVTGPCRDADFPGCGELHALYVLDSAQSAGGGSALLRAAQEQFRKEGCRKMIVCCLAQNASCAFYAHMGGERVKETAWDTRDGRSYPLAVFAFAL